MALGLLFGAVFLYLAVAGIDLRAVQAEASQLRWDIVGLTGLIVVGSVTLRAYRWGLIMAPCARIGLRALVPMTWVGSAAIALLPARGGELVRPYLLHRRHGVPIVDGLAGIVVERVLDVVSILLISGLVAWHFDVPAWLVLGMRRAALIGAGAILVSAAIAWTVRHRFAGALPVLTRSIGAATRSLWQLRGDRPFLRWTALGALSIAQWLPSVAVIHLLGHAFNFRLSWHASAFVMVVIMLGLIVPAPPGFLGNFQFFAMTALGIVGIARESAFGYALLLYAVQMVVLIAGGGLFLVMDSLPLWWRLVHGGARG
jgi:uncharacterized membrane protein YbhN (UPF0104 family)